MRIKKPQSIPVNVERIFAQLTQQHEKSCQCSSPRGHPELTDDQVDSWQQSRPKKGWKKSQAGHWDMVRVGHPYLVETEVALV